MCVLYGKVPRETTGKSVGKRRGGLKMVVVGRGMLFVKGWVNLDGWMSNVAC